MTYSEREREFTFAKNPVVAVVMKYYISNLTKRHFLLFQIRKYTVRRLSPFFCTLRLYTYQNCLLIGESNLNNQKAYATPQTRPV